MSASTSSKTGSAARRGRRAQPGLVEQRREPERLQRDGLAAGVRAADHERAQRRRARGRSAPPRPGRAADGGRRAAAPRRRSRPARRASARETSPHATRQVDRRRGLDERVESLRAVADAPRRARAGSAPPPRAPRRPPPTGGCSARRPRTARRRASGPSPRRRGRCPARCAGARLHREHGPAAALGDEVLLEVLAQAAGRATSCSQLLDHALPAVAQLARAAGGAAARRCRAGPSRLPRRGCGSPPRAARAPGRSRRRSRASSGAALLGLVERRTRAQPPADRRGDVAQRLGREHAAAGRVLAAPRTSWIPSSGGSSAMSSSATASAVSACRRATSSGSADGTSARASSSPWALAAAREPLDDRRKLERHERVGVHATSVRRPASNEFGDMSVATHKNGTGGRQHARLRRPQEKGDHRMRRYVIVLALLILGLVPAAAAGSATLAGTSSSSRTARPRRRRGRPGAASSASRVGFVYRTRSRGMRPSSRPQLARPLCAPTRASPTSSATRPSALDTTQTERDVGPRPHRPARAAAQRHLHVHQRPAPASRPTSSTPASA